MPTDEMSHFSVQATRDSVGRAIRLKDGFAYSKALYNQFQTTCSGHRGLG